MKGEPSEMSTRHNLMKIGPTVKKIALVKTIEPLPSFFLPFFAGVHTDLDSFSTFITAIKSKFSRENLKKRLKCVANRKCVLKREYTLISV